VKKPVFGLKSSQHPITFFPVQAQKSHWLPPPVANRRSTQKVNCLIFKRPLHNALMLTNRYKASSPTPLNSVMFMPPIMMLFSIQAGMDHCGT